MKNPIVELTLHVAKGDLEAAFVVIYRNGKTVRLTGAEAEAAIKKVVPAVGKIKPSKKK